MKRYNPFPNWLDTCWLCGGPADEDGTWMDVNGEEERICYWCMCEMRGEGNLAPDFCAMEPEE